jgi:hypothetical protein
MKPRAFSQVGTFPGESHVTRYILIQETRVVDISIDDITGAAVETRLIADCKPSYAENLIRSWMEYAVRAAQNMYGYGVKEIPVSHFLKLLL